MKKSDRFELVQQVTQNFWTRWTREVIPEAVIRQKWHNSARDLQPDDVVLVHDQSAIKGKYTMAIVESVKTSKDGHVRSAIVGYRIPNPRDKVGEYSGGQWVSLSRSVQRLSLLLPKEEQPVPVIVDNGKVKPGKIGNEVKVNSLKKKNEKWILKEN